MKYYPKGTEKILEFYEGEFESCFILFHPFLKMKREDGTETETERASSTKANAVPDELAEILNRIKLPANAMIYASNENYPEERQIIESGIAISWNQVIEQSNNLNSFQDIQKALKTSIGAYRRIFQRNDLFKNLQEYLKKQKIWSPKEDKINASTKRKLFQIFRLLNLNKIINDDFKKEKTPIDIKEMTELKFCESMNSCFIYSLDKEVMIGQDRDTFFCLLLTKNKEIMDKILESIELEGILCNEETSLPWEFENKEFDELVEKEKEEKNKSKPSKWWSKIFKK